jgi:hypothetical protein
MDRAKHALEGILPHSEEEPPVPEGNLDYRMTELEANFSELEKEFRKHTRHHSTTLEKQVEDLRRELNVLRREVDEAKSAAAPVIGPPAPTPSPPPPPPPPTPTRSTRKKAVPVETIEVSGVLDVTPTESVTVKPTPSRKKPPLKKEEKFMDMVKRKIKEGKREKEKSS